MEVKLQLGALIRFAKFFGLSDSLRALWFGLIRDRMDRRYERSREKGSSDAQPPGSVKWARPMPHGAEVQFEHATLEILFLAPEVLRITWKPGELPIPYAIAANEWPGDRSDLVRNDTGHLLKGTQLSIQVTPEGALQIYDQSGVMIYRVGPPMRRGQIWQQCGSLDPQACIYGLGERARGWNLRGNRYRLWNQDPGGSYAPGHDPLYMSIPVYLCLQPPGSYLIFFENTHRGEIDFTEKVEVHFEGGALRSYFFLGSPAHCLDQYSHLTGRPPLPPRWSLGYHQSRWGYQDQETIHKLADQFKQHDLPLSVIHLDIDYMDGYRVFTYDPQHFGDLETLAKTLEQDGIKLVAILDPGVKVDRGYFVYQEGLLEDMFCKLPNNRPMLSIVWPGWVHFPDFTNPETRKWWGSYYPLLLNQGIAGFWHDMNEPTTFAPWGDKTFPLVTRHEHESLGGDHLGAHNVYALLMNRAGFEALQSARPEQRPWLVSRAGFAGQQRYAWNWTGDVETSWDALRQTLATMLGIGLSGIPYTGSDIGGFSGAPDPELYLRWFQVGAFSPFFRTHSALGTPAREPWVFGDTTLNAVRELLRFRCRLMPYLYTLAWIAHQTGHPLIRPTFWADPQNMNLWDIADQFFLGPDLLIAPVLEQGGEQRTVHFPPGVWYDIWDDTKYEGESLQTVPAGLHKIPVFVRAGSILPIETFQGLELHLYLPDQGILEGILFRDDGDGYGSHSLDQFIGNLNKNTINIRHTSEGDYPWTYTRMDFILHGADMLFLSVDGEAIDCDQSRASIPQFGHLEARIEPF